MQQQQHAPLPGIFPKPRIWDAPNGHVMCELNPSVSFLCEVNGTQMTARLTHAEDDSKHWRYHIRFADGHKAVFQIDLKQKCWVEVGQKTQSPYAKAVNEDLILLNEFNPYHPPLFLMVNVKGKDVRVWVTSEKDGIWIVFHNGKPRFFVHPLTGKWKVDTFDHPESYVVPEVAEAVLTKLNDTFEMVVLDPADMKAALN